MSDAFDVARLEAVLASVGQHLVIDETGSDAVQPSEARRSSWPRILLAAAVVVALAAVAVLAIAPARRAVSGWLHAGNIDVEVDPNLTVEPALPTFLHRATPLAESEIGERLRHAVPDVSGSSLGAPLGWWSPPEPGVLASWNDGDTTLWIVPSVAVYDGEIQKWVLRPAQVKPLPELGDGGFAVDGPHALDTSFRRIRAQNVVAWTDGDLTFRLDSSLPIDDLVTIARALASSGTGPTSSGTGPTSSGS